MAEKQHNKEISIQVKSELFDLPYFGQIDLNSLEEFYGVDIDINGNLVQLDLFFNDKSIYKDSIETVKSFLDNLENLDKRNKGFINQDYIEEGKTVNAYLTSQFERLNPDTISSIINYNETEIIPELQLLEKIHLIGLGIFPHDTEDFAMFDYSIGRAVTDDIIVISANREGDLEYMTMGN